MRAGQLDYAPIWNDVSTLSALHLPGVDIISGGFPCQDISVAGAGRGLDGKRSGLVFEVFRLIEETSPLFVFLENVPAIRTRGGERVVKELARLGYDCRWDCLSAEDVGAPHRRNRWWLLAAHPERLKLREQQGRGCRSDGSDETLSGVHGQDGPLATTAESRQSFPEPFQSRARGVGQCPVTEEVAVTASVGRSQGRPESTGLEGGRGAAFSDSPFHPGWWAVEPDVGRVAHGVPHRVDRLRGLGNAVVPAQAREAFKRLIGVNE
jgi:DNA (cytosine-5)-methyltransferase 1